MTGKHASETWLAVYQAELHNVVTPWQYVYSKTLQRPLCAGGAYREDLGVPQRWKAPGPGVPEHRGAFDTALQQAMPYTMQPFCLYCISSIRSRHHNLQALRQHTEPRTGHVSSLAPQLPH